MLIFLFFSKDIAYGSEVSEVIFTGNSKNMLRIYFYKLVPSLYFFPEHPQYSPSLDIFNEDALGLTQQIYLFTLYYKSSTNLEPCTPSDTYLFYIVVVYTFLEQISLNTCIWKCLPNISHNRQYCTLHGTQVNDLA